VLSRDEFNERAQTAIVAAITSRPQRAGFPLTLPIDSLTMPKPSWVKVSQVRTLAASRLTQRIGRLSDEEMARVIEGLREIVE
jgi:mRNA interferase MazF